MESSISSPAEARRARRGVHLAVAVLGTIGLLLVTLGVLSRSNALHVRRIQVRGTSHLSVADVIRLSGLSQRTNAVWMDPGQAVRRLEADPWIASARVDRELPFGVRITVEERTPVATIGSGGRRLLIAGDGTPLGWARSASALPLIIVPPEPALTGPGPDLRGAARVVGSLPGRIRHEIRRVVVGADGTVRLMVKGGPTIDFGWPEEMVRKTKTLVRLMRWAQGQGARLRSVSLVAADAPAASLAG